MKHRLWASLRETEGTFRHGSGALQTIAAHPPTRRMRPAELARVAGVSEDEARAAIREYVAGALPTELAHDMKADASVDELFALAGRPAPPKWLTKKGPVQMITRDDAGYSELTGGSAIVPIGWFYTMPNRIAWDPNEWHAYFYGQGAVPLPEPVRVDVPTGYDVLCATVLRAPVAPDPNDPSVPAPELARAFAFAMTGGTGGAIMRGRGNDLSVWIASPGGLGPDGRSYLAAASDVGAAVAPEAINASETAPSWPELQPGEALRIDELRKAYDAFRWYGPLPGDVETQDGKLYWQGWEDDVIRERYVFWYAKDDDGNWNKCLQVQGWNGKEWVLPRKWGEGIRVWVWRPSEGASDPTSQGEWRTFFSFDNWINEHKNDVAIVAFWVSSILITVSTLGAGAATLAAAATISAVLIAAQKLYSALLANDPAKAVAAIVELGKAVNEASGGDLVAAIKKNNPGLATFAETVAAPFQKIYKAAGSALGSIETLWMQAMAMRKELPPIGAAAWNAALGAFPGGVGSWIQMGRLPTSSDVARELWEHAPSWAKDAVALALSLSAAEQAQASDRATAVRAPIIRKSSSSVAMMGMGGQAMVQIQAPMAQAIRATWKVPPPPIDPPVPVFNTSSGPPAKAAAAGTIAVAAAGVGVLAYLAGFFR